MVLELFSIYLDHTKRKAINRVLQDFSTFFELGQLTEKEIRLLAGSILLRKSINFKGIRENRVHILTSALEQLNTFERVHVREICFQVLLDG